MNNYQLSINNGIRDQGSGIRDQGSNITNQRDGEKLCTEPHTLYLIPYTPHPIPHTLICSLLFALCSFTSCYLTTVTIHPSAAAFHVVEESPFYQLTPRQKITGMATDGTTVVAVSREGTIAYSEDHGVTWQTADTLDIRINAVTWGGGYFLVGGDFGRAAFSADGKTWETGVIGPMNPKHILALSAGRMRNQQVYVAAGTDGRIAYALNSPQGPWFQISSSPFGDKENEGESIRAIAYGRIKEQGIFVAAGDNGRIAVLKDFSGGAYGPSAAGTQQAFNGAAFGNERFLVAGNGGSMKISADPETYSWITIREREFGMQPFLHVAFAPCINYFVLVASDSVVGFSEYGEKWSAAALSAKLPQGISAVACTKKRIVLGGADGAIVYSN